MSMVGIEAGSIFGASSFHSLSRHVRLAGSRGGLLIIGNDILGAEPVNLGSSEWSMMESERLAEQLKSGESDGF